jgi:hypothetical protein
MTETHQGFLQCDILCPALHRAIYTRSALKETSISFAGCWKYNLGSYAATHTLDL